MAKIGLVTRVFLAGWVAGATATMPAGGTVDQEPRPAILPDPPTSASRRAPIEAHKAVAPALADRFAASSLTSETGERIPYRLFSPENVESGIRYPLVVFLHGSSGSGDDDRRQLQGANMFGALIWAQPEIQRRHPAFVLAPQSRANWPCVILHEGRLPDLCPWPALGEGAREVFVLLDRLVADLPIDPGRIYVTGHSMGGAGVWHLAAHRPCFFAAAVPVSGRADPETAPLLKDLPVWNFHGDADPIEPVETSRRMLAALREAGGRPLATEYEGVGHNAFLWAYTEPALPEWMFAQRRPTTDFPALVRALRSNDAGAVESMIERDPGMVRARDANGYAPLHYAALAGGAREIERLIAAGAEVDARDTSGRTPLFRTVPFANTQTLAALLAHGADLQAVDFRGENALRFALAWGRPQMVELLLERGISLGKIGGEDGRRLLHEAANGGHASLVARLLDAGVPLEIGFEDGTSLLHGAARGGLVALAGRLLDAGAAVDGRDLHTTTPLHLAAFYGRLELVRLLLDRGTAIDAEDASGRTALDLARERGHEEAVELLLSRGARRAGPRFPSLVGPFFGQKEPGRVPELFAPGILSTEDHDVNVSYAPDARALVLSRASPEQDRRRILVMTVVEGSWTVPRPVPFASVGADFEPFVAPDGRRVYFVSDRPAGPGGERRRDTDVWVVDRTEEGWGEPARLGPQVNSDESEFYATVDRGGTMVFQRRGLRIARSRDGALATAEHFPVDGGDVAFSYLGHPLIAPAGDFVVFDAETAAAPDDSDLYVVFRLPGGGWSRAARLLDDPRCRGRRESMPSLSPDGRFLFFEGGGDIYWVSTVVVVEARRRALRPARTPDTAPRGTGATRVPNDTGPASATSPARTSARTGLRSRRVRRWSGFACPSPRTVFRE